MALKTISSFVLTPDWRYGGSTAKLRLYYSERFVDNESRPVVGGSQGFYEEADVTIASFVATVASFSLVTTEDSDHPNVKVTGVLFDTDGTRRETIFEWSVPSNGTIASPATFAAMEAYNNRNHIINPPQAYLTQKQIIDLLNAMLADLGLGPATNLVQGIVLLSVAAADPAIPKVWGHNDPLVRDALKLMGVNLDATMATPANTNVPVYNSVTQKWEPGIGAQGAAGGDLSGTYPNPSVVDDSHLHSIATLVGLGALAILSTIGTAQMDNDAVTYAKMQDVSAASRLLGRGDSGAGDPQEITLGANLTMTGTTLAATGSTGYATVEDEGSALAQRSTLNFTGAGVSAADSGGKTVVTIPGGGSGGAFEDIDILATAW